MDWLPFPTLQRAAKQSVQLWVDLRFLLQHVEQQLVLGGAIDLRLLQSALHHLHLGILLSRQQPLTHDDTREAGSQRRSSTSFATL